MAIEKAPPPTDPYGYADGTAKPGNAIARRHGGRQVRRMEEVREAELYQQWADDLGGEANLTAGQRAILLADG